MARAPVASPPIVAQGDLGVNVTSWARHLRAANLSPNTVRTYLESLAGFARYLDEKGMPTDVANITREHCESYIDHLLAKSSEATAANRYTALRVFFRWAEDEGEVPTSPMARMKKPKITEYLPPVLTDSELRRILAACKGQGFDDRRDMALVRVFIGTGARLSEIANLRWTPDAPDTNDVDLDSGQVRVMGKGRRERLVFIGNKATLALDRYLRARAKHPAAPSPWLWLGRRGRLTDSGIAQAVRERGALAGLPGLHAHMFRHSYASSMLKAGHQEGDVMQLAGWRSREMLARYAGSTRSDRAIAAARRLHPGDEL